MSDVDAVTGWLTAAGHGHPDHLVALKGKLDLPDGSAATPHLVATPKGVFLCASNGTTGRVVDVAQAWPLGWEDGLFNAGITIGAERWVVPTGQATRARRALGIGRVRARAARPPVPVTGPGGGPAEGPWVEGLSPVEETVLSRHLDEGDVVLAWLPTRSELAVAGSPRREGKARWHLLVTRERAALVAVNDVGDLLWRELPTAALVVQTDPGALITDENLVELSRGEVARFVEVAGLPGLVGEARMREAAWRLARYGVAGGELADRILDRLVGTGDPLVKLARATRHPTIDEAEVAAAVAAIPLDPGSGRRLGAWIEEWQPSDALVSVALARLLARADTPAQAAALLAFHRAVRLRRVQSAGDAVAATSADLALAEHLLYCGERTEARALLERRLEALPGEDLVTVAPPEGADLTAGEGAPPLHLRVLELLTHARGNGSPDLSTLSALARHQPLVVGRVRSLSDAAVAGDLAARARRAVDVLASDGLATPVPVAPGRVRAVPESLQERLQHPAVRDGGALGRVQSALAAVEPPDSGLVRSYCERLTEQRYPTAAAAVADGARLLGMAVPQVFISRGERDVGFRSHERPDPFVLVGGAHLDTDGDHHLGPAELRFALGAELAHLRFQHSRVTSDDVWAGVWDKTSTALTVTATVLPFLRFLPVDLLGRDRAARAVATLVPERWLKAVYEVDDAAELAKRLGADPARVGRAGADAVEAAGGTMTSLRAAATRLLPTEVGSDLAVDQARLVVAHRVMQLSADRVGLLLAGDLGAAVRAMFLTSSRLQPELRLAREGGLSAALARRDADGRLLLPRLAVRAAALVAFWLSDDYALLRDAAYGPALGDEPDEAPQPAPPPRSAGEE